MMPLVCEMIRFRNRVAYVSRLPFAKRIARAGHAHSRPLRFRAMHSKLLFNRESQSGRGSAWLERLLREQEVGGSNPLAPTIDLRLKSSARCVGLPLD